MASFWSLSSLLFLILFFMTHNPPSTQASLPYKFTTKISTISASPALLPSPSPSPPPLSPDITPLFPTPGAEAFPPSESSLPTIPSTPSPPNPESISAPGPAFAFPPSGFLPTSSSVSLKSPLGSALDSTLVLSLVVFCLILQLYGI